MPERLVVIGGNAAGMTAAGRARRLRPSLDVTVLESSHFISYSICGVPHLISREVDDHLALLSFTPASLLEERGIQARVRQEVVEIQAGRKRLLIRDMDSLQESVLEYDRLVIATGYRPRLGRIRGVDLTNVFTISRLEDGLRLRHNLAARGLGSALIVGGGYIGLMMAQALRRAGLEVTLVEKEKHVYSQVDPEIAEKIEKQLLGQGVRLILGVEVRELLGESGAFAGVELGRDILKASAALIDIGVEPNVDLASRSGLALGLSGAIAVDARGETSIPSIYAAGNCAECTHLVTGRPVYSKLGTTAARQGRVVGEAIAGLRTSFTGTLETSVEKIFDLCLGRTGLTRRQALEAGFDALSVLVTGRDRAAYYPGSRDCHLLLVFEKRTGRLLGGQVAGDDVTAKRIDTLSVALTAKMTLWDLAQLDLAYAPPYGTLWDPIQIAANLGLRRL